MNSVGLEMHMEVPPWFCPSCETFKGAESLGVVLQEVFFFYSAPCSSEARFKVLANETRAPSFSKTFMLLPF